MPDSRKELTELLRLAYSGELAAALAYRGHWHAVADAGEKEAIRKIETEEWHHRELVGAMLRDLGSHPSRGREIRAWLIGRGLGLTCHIAGWLAPMYGAGKLERKNIGEYERAAGFARDCGRTDLIDCLLTMAEVEWEHEQFFRARVLSHRWASRLPLSRGRLSLWPAPPPKAAIRAKFASPALSR